MKLGKFAAGSITTIIALWIGMLVLKLLAGLLVGLVGFLATLLGVAIVIIKVIFVALLVLFAVGLAYLVYSLFFKPKPSES